VPKCVVITGSIGCGKSSVCKILNSKGYQIIDADLISKKVAKESSAEIASTFGEEFLLGMEIDAKKLGKLVFSDKTAKAKLEAIMHPKIKKMIFEEIAKLEKSDKLFFVDIPLFFESQNYQELTPVAVVYAPKELQLKRITNRDGLNEVDAKSRIASQIDIEEKVKKANFVIDNASDGCMLESKVNNFLEEVDRWFCKNTAQAEMIS
jgi:dephospho-CoA kinase